MHDRVDADGSNELSDERVADVELEVVGAPKVVTWLADVDADDLCDVRVLHEALDDECSPPTRDTGDQDSSLLGHAFP